MRHHSSLELNGYDLTLNDVVNVARRPGASVAIAAEALEQMEQSRAWVDQLQQAGQPVVYGINTGFGSQASISIDKEKLQDLQRNLIMSHAAGTGDPLDVEVVRAAMLLRANTLVRGYSGIRVLVVETLLQMLARDVIPWIPEQGSLGASGDLAPLSHLALVLSRGTNNTEENSGRAYYRETSDSEWELLSGKEAMQRAGIPRIILEAKEGLALNNGTQISTSLLALVAYDAARLLKAADIAMAMSLEALHGISAAFRPQIHELRPHRGQIETAENICRLTNGSSLLDLHPERVQDAYSLRCHPQVMSGVRDTLKYARSVLSVEMNSTNDNPIIFAENSENERMISGGNFHAQPVAFAADFLAVVLCEVGSISERRVFRLSDKSLSYGLPSYLIPDAGLNNGLMIAQYTAASLVSENKAFAHPASIDSIPSSENQEDHVSMAPIAARKARLILKNVQRIIAIELLYAAQAHDLRRQQSEAKITMGRGTKAAFDCIRNVVDFMDADRPVYDEISKILDIVIDGTLVSKVESQAGELN